MHDRPPTPSCYRHPDRPTGLSCTRCGRPACPQCLHAAPVGSHCDECVRAEAKARPAPARRPTPYVTYALIALNVLVFAITVAQSHSLADNVGSPLFRDWVMIPDGVAAGQWIRVIGSGFLHYGPLHLAVNMFALYILGRDTELALGRPRYLAVYLTSLLGGSAAVMWLARDAATAGASGAIYGLFGAVTIILLRLKQSPVQILVLIAINLFISLTLPGISLWGHLGGLATGTLATAGILFLPERAGARTPADAARIGWFAVAGVALAAVVLIGAAAASMQSF
ncbi:rhomboid family intramembrane serine protease [Nocardia stercoris]|uniref:Rhomboid family intramembrane serine protease n=1 Tax=Nocardia stercoris TaxID=2483361 RepID=A0A3M2L968_9NOCA|nr:rhomboid family intramembrane serine protease [Nocardia stercoris]RMI34117.1 rhomboid family intramembrane serine protease [Nocardia stercoris]